MTRLSPLRLAAAVSLSALALGLTDAAMAAPTTTDPWVQSFAAGDATELTRLPQLPPKSRKATRKIHLRQTLLLLPPTHAYQT